MIPAVGEGLAAFRFGPVDPQSMAVWAQILHDPNPIHLDVEAVRAMGLGSRRINQGPINLGYLINGLLQALPGATIEKANNRFVGNVLEGDMVTVTGTVTLVEHEAEGTRVTCDMLLAVDGRGVAITGTLQALVPR